MLLLRFNKKLMSKTEKFLVITYAPGKAKGRSILKPVKEDVETLSAAENLVKKHQKNNHLNIELLDHKKGTKTLYSKELRDKNYSKKVYNL